jgi:hypothetical protein
MLDTATLDPALVYAIVLSAGGAVVGQPVVPARLPKPSSDREGGVQSNTGDASQSLWIRVVGSTRDEGLYEIEVPVRDIEGAFLLGELIEPCIESPADPLWRQLPIEQTWPASIAQTLASDSLSIAVSVGYRSRCVQDPRRTDSFPHPVSFPRFASFVPERPLVVYFDPILARRHLGLDKPGRLLSTIRKFKTERIPVPAQTNEGAVMCVEGAIAFFDPPQIVTLEGRPGELVVVTPKPAQSGKVTEDWLLGFVRNEYFSFFRETVERLDDSYRIVGEWRYVGAFETDYGVRSEALLLSAAAHLGRARPDDIRDGATATLRVDGPGDRKSSQPETPPSPLTAHQRLLVTAIFSDADQLIHLRGQTHFISRDMAALIKVLWRLQQIGSMPVPESRIFSEFQSPDNRSVNAVLRKESPALTRHFTYDLAARGWQLTELVLPRVFLSYATENRAPVILLHDALESLGFGVWMDTHLRSGQDWKTEINKSLEQADFFVVCLSLQFANRLRSGVFPELYDAIALQRQCPPDAVFILVAELSNCDIPLVRIDGVRTLRDLQATKLYPEKEWTAGVHNLASSMRTELLRKVKSAVAASVTP